MLRQRRWWGIEMRRRRVRKILELLWEAVERRLKTGSNPSCTSRAGFRFERLHRSITELVASESLMLMWMLLMIVLLEMMMWLLVEVRIPIWTHSSRPNGNNRMLLVLLQVVVQVAVGLWIPV